MLRWCAGPEFLHLQCPKGGENADISDNWAKCFYQRAQTGRHRKPMKNCAWECLSKFWLFSSAFCNVGCQYCWGRTVGTPCLRVDHQAALSNFHHLLCKPAVCERMAFRLTYRRQQEPQQKHGVASAYSSHGSDNVAYVLPV